MRKNRIVRIICALAAIFFVIILIPSGEVSAAASVITQTKYATDSVTVNWTKVRGATEYYLGIGENKEASEKDAEAHTLTFDSDTIHYTYTGLKAGMNYYVTLRYRYVETDGVKEAKANTSIVKTIPDKVKGVTQARWYIHTKKVYITWEAQTAGFYRYVFMNKSGKRIRAGDAFTNSLKKNVDNEKCYSFKVKSVAVINGKTYESAWSDRIYLFAQPMIRSYNYGNDFDLHIEGGKLKLSWDKTKYANGGYNIYVSKSRDKGYVKVARAGKNKNTATVSKFKGSSYKKNETYYVYVEGVRKSGGRRGGTGIGYVWQYKKGNVRQTYYHGQYS